MGKYKKSFMSVQWHITSNCLNRCKHCYMYDKEYKAENCSYKDFVLIYENIKSFFKKYNIEENYIITGGSPFLNPECEDIFSFLHENGKSISLLDIPEMVTDHNINVMNKNNIKEYQVSLDVLETTHDSIRGQGSFKRTISSLHKLIDNSFKPKIMFTVNNYNKNELSKLCEYLVKELKQFVFSFDFAVCTGNAKKELEHITQDEFNNVLDMFLEIKKVYSDGWHSFTLKPSIYEAYKYNKNKDIDYRISQTYSKISGCLIGFDSICILQNGDVLPCRRLPIIIGNLKEKSMEEIFLKNKLMKKFRRFNVYSKGCNSCEYSLICRGCPAITYGITGDCFESFPYCNSYKEKTIEIDNEEYDINCTNEEEINIIKSTFNSSIVYKAKELLKNNPNIFVMNEKNNPLNLSHDEKIIAGLIKKQKH